MDSEKKSEKKKVITQERVMNDITQLQKWLKETGSVLRVGKIVLEPRGDSTQAAIQVYSKCCGDWW